MIHQFANEDGYFRSTLIAIKENLKRYYTACFNADKSFPAAEKAISERFPVAIHRYVDKHIIHPEEFELSSQKHPSLNEDMFFINGEPFCSYEASKGVIFDSYETYLLPENYVLTKEGDNIVKMVDDVERLSVEDRLDIIYFREAYHINTYREGSDKLIKRLCDVFCNLPFKEKWSGDFDCDWRKATAISGICRNLGTELIPDLIAFFDANKKHYNYTVKDGDLYLNGDTKVDHLEAEFYFARPNVNCPFELYQAQINCVIDDKAGIFAAIPFSFSITNKLDGIICPRNEDTKHIGKVFTEKVFEPYFHEVILEDCEEQWIEYENVRCMICYYDPSSDWYCPELFPEGIDIKEYPQGIYTPDAAPKNDGTTTKGVINEHSHSQS